MLLNRLAFFVVASSLVACGGGGDGGTDPPPPPPPSQTLGSITTNVSTLNLVAGSTQTIAVTARDTEGAIIANPGSPSFTSTSSAIAEVDGGGNVFALTQGTTTINVSLTRGGVTRTASVATTVTGALPTQAGVSTVAGDAFTPNRVAISLGGQVTWTFGVTEHTVVFSAAGAPSSITSGGYSSSQSRTFAQAGNFSYQCTIHAGMNGQVIVR